jgi:hypothetical protein
MTDDYEDLLAEMAKLGRLELQPVVVIWKDSKVNLTYVLGPYVLNVLLLPDRTIQVWLPGYPTAHGWDGVAKFLHRSDPRAKFEWFSEPLETLRRHLEGQVWLLRLLLEMR